MTKLTDKQAAFVAEYLIDLNATQAAVRAGYSAKTANEQGARLLANVSVRAAIEAKQAEREQRTEITADMVVLELSKIAFGDLRGSLTWGPGGVSLKDCGEISDDDAAAIAEVGETVTKDGGSIRIRRHDKVKALELLGKHLGMFTEKHEHSISANLAEAIAEGRKRVAER